MFSFFLAPIPDTLNTYHHQKPPFFPPFPHDLKDNIAEVWPKLESLDLYDNNLEGGLVAPARKPKRLCEVAILH